MAMKEDEILETHRPEIPRCEEVQGIAITGASSDIGRALAITQAEPGKHLYLSARREVKLHELATTIESLGAKSPVCKKVYSSLMRRFFKLMIAPWPQKHR